MTIMMTMIPPLVRPNDGFDGDGKCNDAELD